jgi:integrase
MNQPKAWTLDELKRLLHAARGYSNRDYVLLLMSVCHGLRVSEAIRLRKRDISGGCPKLSVNRLKGSEATSQRLQENADPLLNERVVVTEYTAKLGPNDLLFPDKDGGMLTRWQVYSFVQKYGRLAGIDEDRLHPHCCKHSLGTLMRKNGADIKTIQLALGHKNINSTAVYMNASEDEVDNARAKAFAFGAAVGVGA